jgi:hypothetical protein
MLARVRKLIREADPGVIEEVKWRKPSNPSGVPVWEHALLDDPSGLFNSSLEGNTRRAIDLHDGDEIDEEALKALICEAAALNQSQRR